MAGQFSIWLVHQFTLIGSLSSVVHAVRWLILSFGFLTAHEYFVFPPVFSSRMLLSLFRFAHFICSFRSRCLFQLRTCYFCLFVCFKSSPLSVRVNDQLLPKTILRILMSACMFDWFLQFICTRFTDFSLKHFVSWVVGTHSLCSVHFEVLYCCSCSVCMCVCLLG